MGTVVLDASVLIGFLDREDANHRAADTTLTALRGRHDLVLPAVAFAEVMVGAYSGGSDLVVATADRIRNLMTVEPLTEEIAGAAAGIRARTGVRLADATILATADAVEAGEILTADRRWRRADPRVRVIGSRSR
jgi:predicted nucleic acid-binding protein